MGQSNYGGVYWKSSELNVEADLHFLVVVLKLLGALHVLLDLVGASVYRRESVVSQRLGVVGVRQRRLQDVAEVLDRVKIPEENSFSLIFLKLAHFHRLK